MRRIPATEFITRVGTYMDAARSEPVAVTSHGREKVILLSPEEYRRLRDAAARKQGIDQKDEILLSRIADRIGDPLKIALSIINTSTPVTINAADFARLPRRPKQLKAQARLLIEEVPQNVLASLVRHKHITWNTLHELAEWVDTRDHEKKAFIRDMAGLPLDNVAKAGRSRS
jgi:prevent-host-death family protein